MNTSKGMNFLLSHMKTLFVLGEMYTVVNIHTMAQELMKSLRRAVC